MHRVGARAAGRVEQAIDAQIGLDRRRRPDGDRGVRRAHVRREPIGLGKDRHRLEALLTARPDDPEGDLTAIGDQDAIHRRRSVMGDR
jgi:hypothetical protein